jgi:hypothetical protein
MCVVCVRGCMGCVVHSSWTCGYWLGIGLGLRAGLRVRVCHPQTRTVRRGGSNFLPNPPQLRWVHIGFVGFGAPLPSGSISKMCSIIFMLGCDAHINAYQET